MLMCEQEATVLKGQRESEFFSYESVAIVRSIGCKVADFQINDRVLALIPGKFDNSFIVNQNLCHKLLPEEKIEDLAGLFVPTCSALHALNNLIWPRKREVSLNGANMFRHKADPSQPILVHVPGDHLLASAFIKIGLHRGLEV
jgi:NADPH:quinone reductase-like Zn-dependent oxidoreductase